MTKKKDTAEDFNIFKERGSKKNLERFAAQLMALQDQIGFKVSARGWCYQLESERFINKDEFNRVEEIINRCRKMGILPIDFVAEEESRQFSVVHEEDSRTPIEYLKDYVGSPLDCWRWYHPDWWEGERYYIQMIVEKIDLKNLFLPICEQYHIPIATSKGWSSMLQRAEYTRRFEMAQERGMQTILLYCGDHDPDGLRISDFLRSNMEDLKNIRWEDGMKGFDPKDLVIERFGLDKHFISKHNLTWIDNLITGSGKDLNDKKHRNHHLPYLQQYLKEFGAKKCEANAIVPIPEAARQLVEDTIIFYLGKDAVERFNEKREVARRDMYDVIKKIKLENSIKSIIKRIDKLK
jgi:hypothetical protein